MVYDFKRFAKTRTFVLSLVFGGFRTKLVQFDKDYFLFLEKFILNPRNSVNVFFCHLDIEEWLLHTEL